MTDPINASIDPALCSVADGVSAQELDAQTSIASAHPTVNAARTAPAPSAATAPPSSPAVTALVSRFTAPAGTHPPVEPSLGEAMLNCKLPITNYLLSVAAVVAAAPETGGASLIAAGKILTAAIGVQACLSQNEAEQVQNGNRAALAADCRADGAIPLTTTDGQVVCAK